MTLKNVRKGTKSKRAFDPDLVVDPDDMPSAEEERDWEKWDEDLEMEKVRNFAKYFIPPFPLYILHAIVEAKAEAAFPIVSVAHRWMQIRRRKAMPLAFRLWDDAGYGDPVKTRHRRQTIIANLKKIPQVMKLTPRRSRVARYWLAYGSLWKQKKRTRPE